MPIPDSNQPLTTMTPLNTQLKPIFTLEPTSLKRWTVQDYHLMSELGILDSNERTELIAGQITLMTAKGTPHVTALRLLATALDELLAEQSVFVSTQDPIQLDDLTEIKTSVCIDFFSLEKFLNIDPCIFQKILQLITRINIQKNISIQTSGNFFFQYFDCLGKNTALIKKGYLQQNRIQLYFDYEGNGFLRILKLDANFLIEYINSLFEDNDTRLSSDDYRDLGFIWEIVGIETQLIKVFDLIIPKYPYIGILSHFCNIFFRRVDVKHNLKVDKFIIKYTKKYNNCSDKMNVIIDIVRNSKNQLYDQVLLYFISLNQDVKIFSKIYWRGNGSSVTGDETHGDIEAADWRKILSIVEKSAVGFKLIPIKKYLNDRVESSLRRADGERKQKFLGRR